ncbi:MAG: DUF4878 domain-containing protein [Bacteroidales bacterium]|nr:DUF4878 domain-containing protein [Bacteroidales bacterium]
MRKIVCLWIAAALFCLAGCSKNTPKGVVDKYYSDLQHKNYEAAVQNFVIMKDSETSQEEMLASFADKLGKSLEEEGGLKSYKILRDSICNDSVAVVFTQFTKGNGESADADIRVVLEGETWKIDPLSK